MQQSVRSIWIADAHLGTRDAKSEFLLHFLKNHQSRYLYLTGDIFDFWEIGRKWYWPPENNMIIQLILERASKGTEVIYIPGNHDAGLRKYAGTVLKGIRIEREAVHQGADGRNFLVVHGDEYDHVSTHSEWLARLGSDAYQLLLRLNRFVNRGRRLFGREYWSLSAWLKYRVKKIVNFISRFEEEIAKQIQSRQVDGLICGHIHHAALELVDGRFYSNVGDWVESCTALLEDNEGLFQVVRWTEKPKVIFSEKNLLHHSSDNAHCYPDRRLASAG